MTRTKIKSSKRPAQVQSSPPRISRQVLLGAGILIAATVLVYLPAIRGGFIWDDPDYVVNNQTLRDVPGLFQMWLVPRSLPQWYPMVHTTFWIEYHLWGLAPMGYHIDNVLLHIFSSLLLWRLLRALQVPGHWLAAAIFALHPVQVESVAWITERKNVLSGVFYFLAMLAYLRWKQEPGTPRPARYRWYAGSLLLFLAALLSKTVTATFPAAILVILWWKRGTIRRRDVVPLVPFFILGIGLGLFTAYLEKTHVGATGERIAELNIPPIDRVLIAGRVIGFYAGKLVWPHPLAFIYPRWEDINPRTWWQWLFPLGVVAVLVLLVLSHKRLGRGPAAAAMLFCGTLFPALGFINVYPMRFSFVADHFQYLASAALIALVATVLCKIAGVWGRIVLAPLALVSFFQAANYTDAQTLWRDTLKKNPDSWMVRTNLGKVLVDQGEQTGDESALAEAEEQYLAALNLAPGIYYTHVNAGMVLGRRGNTQGALREFDEALRLNPQFAPAYYGRGQVYSHLGQTDKAVENYRKALAIAPQYPEANYRLGVILEQRRNLPEAIEHYRAAVGAAPGNADARYNLATCLIRLGHYDEAVYNLLEAVRMRPGWAQAWANLGAAQLLCGHRLDAEASFRQALRIDPRLVPAQRGLDRALQP